MEDQPSQHSAELRSSADISQELTANLQHVASLRTALGIPGPVVPTAKQKDQEKAEIRVSTPLFEGVLVYSYASKLRHGFEIYSEA